MSKTIAKNVRLPKGYEVAWAPHPGPQTAFLAASEFEVFYGGAKGGGKSDAILAASVRQVDKPRYRALILRATYGEVEELILRSRAMFRGHPMGPQWSGEHKRWNFPTGSFIQFGYCSRKEDAELYMGREWAYIGFDELGNIPDENVWIDLLKEIRCPDKSVVRMARATGNPGFAGHAWLKKRFIATCGKRGERVHVFEMQGPEGGPVLRLTRRFIPAKITDNPVYSHDAQYLAILQSLPEARRRQLLEGDWDVGIGIALEELDYIKHFVKPFDPPDHWPRIGGFDWGFAHRWVAVEAVVSEDGTIYVVDTVKGWRDLPDVIAERMSRGLSPGRTGYISASPDCWQRHRSRSDHQPTIAEKMVKAGIPLVPANADRVMGLNNLRDYVSWRGRGPGGEDVEPALMFMDTPGNRWLFDQLESMVTDPDDPEVVLKQDSDVETGEGGDDGYDALRFLVASRPPRARSVGLQQQRISAWDPDVLRHEVESTRRVKHSTNVRTERVIDPMMTWIP